MVSVRFVVIAICSVVSVMMQAGAVFMAYLEFRDARPRRKDTNQAVSRVL